VFLKEVTVEVPKKREKDLGKKKVFEICVVRGFAKQ